MSGLTTLIILFIKEKGASCAPVSIELFSAGFLYLRSLAFQSAQIIEFRASDFTATGNFDLYDFGRVNGESSFDADT